MATGWVKSMQCKYAALDDVVHRHHHRYHRHESHSNHHRYHRHESDSKHHHNHTTASTSCRKSVENLKGIIETTKQIKKSKQPPPPPPPVSRIRHNPPPPPPPPTVTPALTELSEGHQSRNVVEIIFHTGWSPKAFIGRMEMVFKVQNAIRTVTRFEEYRDTVKSRADTAGHALQDGGSEDLSRCIADGNEMMRFQCLGPTNGGPVCDAGGAWGVNAIKGAAAICTFSGSGGAHDAAGGGKGRRAMLVCRVIAGRVCKRLGLDSLLEDRVGFDSVSGEDDELFVFDSRAVLPCFLIIYKL